MALLLPPIMVGCEATGPVFQTAPTPAAGQALVYLYRQPGFVLGGRDAYFYLNDINVADLSANGYAALTVPAGGYSLKQRWPVDIAFGKTIELQTNWQPGGTYYYRFETSSSGMVVTGMTLIWRLRATAPEAGQIEITQMRQQTAFNLEKVRPLRPPTPVTPLPEPGGVPQRKPVDLNELQNLLPNPP